MRLGKCVKINTIIAILICMAFVVNIGTTFAALGYSFLATSINTTTDTETRHETYTEFDYANGNSGRYTYSVGSVNNCLNIDYGFSHAYDLKVNFTATYTTASHKAQDFSLNFANRDMWLIDTQLLTGLSTSSQTAQEYYSFASATNTISGTMYYMGTLTGAGTLPVISGVTFYTSPNNSYQYIGDTLTVTITPVYTKANSDNYGTSHTFAGTTPTTAFTNWAKYMSNTVDSSVYMLYNSYVNNSNALAYPSDFNWNNSFNLTAQSEPLYSNVAYRYNLKKQDLVKTYAQVTAGNKYYGGIGVYVIPKDITAVSFTIDYHWQKSDGSHPNGLIDGDMPNNMVEVNYSSDIVTIEKTNVIEGVSYTYEAYYYKYKITKPTYINILDSIMLTAAAGFRTVLDGGYSLVINNITVIGESTSPSEVEEGTKNYDISNSSTQSPILVRIEDIRKGDRDYNTNVSITNNTSSAIKLTSFKVKGELWYGKYTDNYSVFNKQSMGYLPDDSLTYDNDIWNIKEYADNTYTFELKNSAMHIPVGYTLPIITSVKVPQQSNYATFGENETEKEVNDFWCQLEILDVTVAAVSDYTEGSYSGIETIVEGYYSSINQGEKASIYVRNNTNQNITSLTLSNLRMAALSTEDSDLLARDNLNTSTEFNYTIMNEITGIASVAKSTNNASLTVTITLKPNEMIKLCTLSASVTSVIYTYKVTGVLANAENEGVNLLLDVDMKTIDTSGVSTAQITTTATILNVGSKVYEFRLKSTQSLATKLTNSSDFIEQETEVTENNETITYYYYYYKGAIYSNYALKVLNSFGGIIEVEAIEHIAGATDTQYVAENYATWTPPTEWLTYMGNIYGEPSNDLVEGAVVVSPTVDEEPEPVE